MNTNAQIEVTFTVADSYYQDIKVLMERTPMPYDRVLTLVGRLAGELLERETDEFIWGRVGEFQEFDLAALITGAWHHLYELDSYARPYHNEVYQRLGAIYSPGMSGEMDDDYGAELVLSLLDDAYREVTQ